MKRVLFLTAISVFFVLNGQNPFFWQAQLRNEKLAITLRIDPNSYIEAKNIEFKFSGRVKPLKIPAPVNGNYSAGKWQWEFSAVDHFTAQVSFQGCTNELCLMPKTVKLWPQNEKSPAIHHESIIPARKIVGLINSRDMITFLKGNSAETQISYRNYGDRGFLMIILLTLIGGLGLNLTPCVLPMIPVNLAIIGVSESRFTGLKRGTAYAAGMAGAYGIIGALAILSGATLGQLNSSSVFNWVIALIFVILSLSMFGVFNIDFSRFFHIKPSKIKGGKTVAALLMGAVAAILAGACVAPVVIAVFLFASERYASGNPWAVLLPLVLGLGMALPWPLAGFGLGILPKPGRFMVMIKYGFGIIIMIAAIYYGYLGWQLRPGKYNPKEEIVRLHNAIAQGKRENKPVLVDFWASWCKNCTQLEKTTMQDPEVLKNLAGFIVIKFQCEHPDQSPAKELLDSWQIPGFPALVIIDPRTQISAQLP